MSDSYDPVDCSPPGSSVHGILQARILEWVVISFSRGSSQPRDWTQVSCLAGRFFTNWAMREAHSNIKCLKEKINSSRRWPESRQRSGKGWLGEDSVTDAKGETVNSLDEESHLFCTHTHTHTHTHTKPHCTGMVRIPAGKISVDSIPEEVMQCPSFYHCSVRFSSVSQSRLTLCDPMNHSTPGLPVHHQLPEFTQTHIHWVSDAIQPSHPLSSPSPPVSNPSQHHSLFQWVNSLHEVAKVLEFQL